MVIQNKINKKIVNLKKRYDVNNSLWLRENVKIKPKPFVMNKINKNIKLYNIIARDVELLEIDG